MTTSEKVMRAVMDCEGAAFDGCHKVFVLMDKEQVELMRGYGYGKDNDSHLVTATDGMTRSAIFEMVKVWYQEACALKFIQATTTMPSLKKEPETGYENLIPQGGYWK